MSYRFLLLSILAFCSHWAAAQPTFQKQLDRVSGLFCLEQTADSTYWLGTFLGKMLRLDAKGQLLGGMETYRGDTTNTRFIYDLKRAPGGGVFALFDRSNYNTALDDYLILARLSASGQPLWQTSVYFGEVQHWAHNRLAVDPQGNVFITSVRLNPTGSDLTEPNRVILSKVNAAGALLWTKAFRSAGLNYPRALNRLSDGTLLVCGNGQLSASYGFMLRLTPDGQIIWGKRYNKLLFKAFVELSDGTWALAATESGPLPQATCILRMDQQGNLIWVRRLLMPYALNWIPGLRIAPDGNILIFNYETPSDTPCADLICLSTDGDFQWARRYDACHNYGISAGLVTTDGGIAGIRFRANGHLFLKTDAEGHCTACPAQDVQIPLEPLSDTPFPTLWESEDWPASPAADVDFLPFSVQVSDYCGQEKPVTGFSLTPDTLCAFQPVSAFPTGPGQADSYQWTFAGGSPAPITTSPVAAGISFDTPGPAAITLETKFGFCTDTFSRTILVRPGPSPIDLGPDTTLCGLAGRLTLDATTPGATAYQWDDGTTNPVREIKATNVYSVRASGSGCSVQDTIRIELLEKLPVFLGNDTTICATDTLWLDATVAGAERYHWNDGLDVPRRPVTESGFYAVTAYRAGCSGSGLIDVELFPRPPALPADTVLCEGEPLVLNAGENPGDAVLWNGQPGFSTLEFDSSGLVRRTVKYRNCRFDDSTFVHRAPCRQGFAFYAPNAFAPGNDSPNQFFELSGADLDVLELQIFDRWGNRISVGKNTPRWDGQAKGKPAAPGVYIWLALLRQRGREGWLSGDALLVR